MPGEQGFLNQWFQRKNKKLHPMIETMVIPWVDQCNPNLYFSSHLVQQRWTDADVSKPTLRHSWQVWRNSLLVALAVSLVKDWKRLWMCSPCILIAGLTPWTTKHYLKTKSWHRFIHASWVLSWFSQRAWLDPLRKKLANVRTLADVK